MLRRRYDTVPPQVEYALSPLGEGLLAQIESPMDWVRRHNARIHAARRAVINATKEK